MFRKSCFSSFCSLIIFFSTFSQSTETLLFQSFKKLSCPEKCWAIFHPFVAKKAFEITKNVNEISLKMKNDSLLDRDITGGQVDAFRHAFWMAVLCRKIYWRKAYKLGKAHEKGNEIDFKKHKTEDDFLPDKASVEMDLFNNKVGILIGKHNKNIPENELAEKIKQAVLRGEMKIIKKDFTGNSLDENNQIISDWQGKWENRRALVSSDYERL